MSAGAGLFGSFVSGLGDFERQDLVCYTNGTWELMHQKQSMPLMCWICCVFCGKGYSCTFLVREESGSCTIPIEDSRSLHHHAAGCLASLALPHHLLGEPCEEGMTCPVDANELGSLPTDAEWSACASSYFPEQRHCAHPY